MVVVPGTKPVTIPLLDPIFAIVVELLVHTPPVTASLRVIVLPTHTEAGPVIVAGVSKVVTIVVILQPVPAV